jgi:hypothetical protein
MEYWHKDYNVEYNDAFYDYEKEIPGNSIH